MIISPQQELELAQQIAEYYADPYGFTLFSFPWGEGQLTHFPHGPHSWQIDYLLELGDCIKDNAFDGTQSVPTVRMARSSGHGIGKSALVGMVTNFFMSTRKHAKGIITANTSDQLRTKTWAEIGKWHKLCITRHWFDYNSSKGNMNLVSKMDPETWRCDAQTCREENSESFAGLHAIVSSPFYIFDEASAIPDKIYEVSAGGTTDGEPFWLLFGNPTKNDGEFYQSMFGNQRHRWRGKVIDSRDVPITNKGQINEWLEDYGEDSDRFRVRVRGLPPSASTDQFIPRQLIKDGKTRECVYDPGAPVIVGVDVARFGDDQTVIRTRMGRDARSIKPIRIAFENTQTVASRVADHIDFLKKHGYGCDVINVDGGGVGGGVVDRLRALGLNVNEVNFGETAQDKAKYSNRAAEMWGRMRDWLRGGCIDKDDYELEEELVSRKYSFSATEQIVLERKVDMKKRGRPSPDNADALALTFAENVMRRDMPVSRVRSGLRTQAITEYDVFA